MIWARARFVLARRPHPIPGLKIIQMQIITKTNATNRMAMARIHLILLRLQHCSFWTRVRTRIVISDEMDRRRFWSRPPAKSSGKLGQKTKITKTQLDITHGCLDPTALVAKVPQIDR